MKVLLHFSTAIGPRAIVAEIGDRDSAQAIVNTHLSLDQRAAIVEEMPRLSMKDHAAKHKRAMAKATKLSVVPRADNVTPLRKAKGRGE